MRLALAFAVSLLALPLGAQTAPETDVEVDIELVLAVDVSRSMSPYELEIQRRGYAEALTSHEVLGAIGEGFLGRIALTYVEWAGNGSTRIVVPWTLVSTRAEAEAVAGQLTAEFRPALRRTSISGALLFAARLFDDNGFTAWRRVIDVSGDGPNNHGLPVLRAREIVLGEGIVINGLPLMTRDGFGGMWHLDDLDEYYLNCVIGGPGAFVVPVTDWSQFAAAVKRKLILEIAGLPPRVLPAAEHRAAPYDCLIGEKIWERNRGRWDWQ
jgi:hypothetical protein